MSNENLVYALGACVTYVDGKRVATKINEPWDADDPVVQARPDLFTPAPVKVNRTVDAPVETATAEPGAKRKPGRPRKQTAG